MHTVPMSSAGQASDPSAAAVGAGVVVGLLVALAVAAVLVIAVLTVYRKRRQSHELKTTPNDQDNTAISNPVYGGNEHICIIGESLSKSHIVDHYFTAINMCVHVYRLCPPQGRLENTHTHTHTHKRILYFP